MSELRATTLSDAAGTGPTEFTGQWATKAFLTYNLDTATTLDTANIASITDSAVGQYTFTFTNSMSNTNYSGSTTHGEDTVQGASGGAFGGSNQALATSGWGVDVRNAANTSIDVPRAFMQIWGDLA